MGVKIKGYETKDEQSLFALISSDEEWKDYCRDESAIKKYRTAVENCITYVLYENDTLCGFIRATDDFGFGIYINDLLVHKNFRGKSYGKSLIEQVCADFPGTVYVLSDVDEYYRKQGYSEIEGSVVVVRG